MAAQRPPRWEPTMARATGVSGTSGRQLGRAPPAKRTDTECKPEHRAPHDHQRTSRDEQEPPTDRPRVKLAWDTGPVGDVIVTAVIIMMIQPRGIQVILLRTVLRGMEIDERLEPTIQQLKVDF